MIKYQNENEFRKRKKALSRYFRKNYKYLMYTVFPKLKEEHKVDGKYELELPTNDLFTRIYGPMKLLFSVKNDITYLEDIIPNNLLTLCYERDLPTYKGIPYASKKDFKKLKIMEKLI